LITHDPLQRDGRGSTGFELTTEGSRLGGVEVELDVLRLLLLDDRIIFVGAVSQNGAILVVGAAVKAKAL